MVQIKEVTKYRWNTVSQTGPYNHTLMQTFIYLTETFISFYLNWNTWKYYFDILSECNFMPCKCRIRSNTNYSLMCILLYLSTNGSNMISWFLNDSFTASLTSQMEISGDATVGPLCVQWFGGWLCSRQDEYLIYQTGAAGVISGVRVISMEDHPSSHLHVLCKCSKCKFAVPRVSHSNNF